MVAVLGSYLFPVGMHLTTASNAAAPTGLEEILTNMLTTIFSNPIKSLSDGEYLGILFWSIVFGIALKIVASDNTKNMMSDFADAITLIVRGIIQFAPIGIMGLVYTSVSENGIGIFTEYGQLILLLVGCIAFVALITDPLIAGFALRRNPYPSFSHALKKVVLQHSFPEVQLQTFQLT